VNKILISVQDFECGCRLEFRPAINPTTGAAGVRPRLSVCQDCGPGPDDTEPKNWSAAGKVVRALGQVVVDAEPPRPAILAPSTEALKRDFDRRLVTP
jgi:hypothetical protein